MRISSVILLAILVLLPILWNGISLIHFTTAHTHTFCGINTAHCHQNPVSCTAICQLTHEPNQSPSPSPNNDFQEIKLYFTFQILKKKANGLAAQNGNFALIHLTDTPFFQDILHPPILSSKIKITVPSTFFRVGNLAKTLKVNRLFS